MIKFTANICHNTGLGTFSTWILAVDESNDSEYIEFGEFGSRKQAQEVINGFFNDMRSVHSIEILRKEMRSQECLDGKS